MCIKDKYKHVLLFLWLKTESENIFYKITYVCSINTFKDMEDQLFERLSGENIEFEHESVDEEDLGAKTFTFDITKRTETDAKRNAADVIWSDASS